MLSSEGPTGVGIDGSKDALFFTAYLSGVNDRWELGRHKLSDGAMVYTLGDDLAGGFERTWDVIVDPVTETVYTGGSVGKNWTFDRRFYSDGSIKFSTTTNSSGTIHEIVIDSSGRKFYAVVSTDYDSSPSVDFKLRFEKWTLSDFITTESSFVPNASGTFSGWARGINESCPGSGLYSDIDDPVASHDSSSTGACASADNVQ